jgi:beta-glucosidase-like glycosyl hydrolase
MEMKAVSEFAPIHTLVEQSLRAGVDLFLISHTRQKWEDARAHLLTTAKNNEVLHAHIMTAWKRVHDLKSSFFAHAAHPWEPQVNWREGLGCEAHREVVGRVAWQTLDILHDPTEQEASD